VLTLSLLLARPPFLRLHPAFLPSCISNEKSVRTPFHTFSPDFEKRCAEAFARQMALKSGCVPRTRWEKEYQVNRMFLLTLGVPLKSLLITLTRSHMRSTCKLCLEQAGSTCNPIFDSNHPLYERIEYKTERSKVIGMHKVSSLDYLSAREVFLIASRLKRPLGRSNFARYHSQN
jgi:hypothetical protein